MAVRNTSALVQGILGDNYNGSMDLTPFIATASVITDRVATCASGKGMALSATELELIERWLAAHFYEKADQMYTSNSTAGASASFQGQTGMHLEQTYYGQSAMDLDYSGCLAAISKRAFAFLDWLGKVPSDQIPYEQRD